jgi:hypothetical protein
MARYLVIEFEDNASAEKLMAKIDDARAQGALYRVVGLFVKPRNYCECPSGPAETGGMNHRKDSAKARGGIAYGRKYGWWVCTVCKRPRKAGHQLVNQLAGTELYESTEVGDYEMLVTNLSVYAAPKKNLTRKLAGKLRKKEKK